MWTLETDFLSLTVIMVELQKNLIFLHASPVTGYYESEY